MKKQNNNNKTNKSNKSKKNITKKNKLTSLLENNNVTIEKYHSFEKEMANTFNNKKTVEQIQSDLAKMFLKPFSPKSIKPSDDFYTYINYEWLNDAKVKMVLEKKFYTQYDNFRLVQEKVYYDLMTLVDEYIKTNKNPLSRQLSNLLNSLNNGSDKKAEKQIKKTIKIIDTFIENDDLYGLLAYLNRNELVNIASPISWNVIPDLHNPTIYRSHIHMPKLPLYDLDLYVYNENDPKYRKQYKTFFKNRYVEYCVDLFDAIDFRKDRDPASLYNIGSIMYLTMGSTSVPDTDPNFYNIVKKEDAEIYGFDWNKFTKCLGYKIVPDFFIVDNLSYLKSMMEILNKDWKTKEWRDWFIYINVKQQIRFHENYYQIYFSFYRKFVQGAEFRVPKTISPIFLFSLCFNKFLSVEYIKKFSVKDNIDFTKNLIEDLKFVFMRIIENNDWLSPKTKKYALLKLKYLKYIVGTQEDIIDDPIIEYSKDDCIENVDKIYKWRLEKFISLEGKTVIDMPYVDWTDLKLAGKQVYIVNAFYTPQRNDIYIPLAYLQKPFIDLSEKNFEYNLANIGFTISHEMSHCLDDTGSKYDYLGNIKNWWTKQDKEKYQKKIENVVNQYKVFASYDNVNFDATNAAGECLADISGLAICEQYLRDYQIKNNYIPPIRNLSFIEFFTYFTIQMRQSMAKKAYRVHIVTNPHPPDKYRVNVPLSRLKLFRSVYDIKKDDKMYWRNIEPIW